MSGITMIIIGAFITVMGIVLMLLQLRRMKKNANGSDDVRMDAMTPVLVVNGGKGNKKKKRVDIAGEKTASYVDDQPTEKLTEDDKTEKLQEESATEKLADEIDETVRLIEE